MPTREKLQDELNIEHLHADLKSRSVRGGVVTLAAQGAQFTIQTVATVVLARILSPSDFGIVAMVMVVTVLGMAFADLGLSEATIQRKEITHDQVTSLFWINAAIGSGLTIITAALAPVLAWFYNEPRVIAITLVSSVTFLMGGLRVQADALLRRQMRYGYLAFKDVAAVAIAVPIAITIASRGGGYWALVALPLTINFMQLVMSWMMVRWRPGLPRRNSNVGSLVAFGRDVAASYFIFTLNRSADNALIGWYWGAAPLGLYSRAYNLLMLPIRQLSAPMASVAVPAFSRIHNDPERYARYYLATTNLMMWIIAPLFGFLFVAARPVVIFVLGGKWEEAAPVFQMLSISGPGQVLLESTIWILVSRGLSGRLLKLLLYATPFILGSFVFGLPFGIKSVALSYALVILTILPFILQFTFRDTHLTLKSLGRAIVYPISISLTGVLCAEITSHYIHAQNVFLQFLVVGLGFVVALLMAAFIRPAREEILSFRKIITELGMSD